VQYRSRTTTARPDVPGRHKEPERISNKRSPLSYENIRGCTTDFIGAAIRLSGVSRAALDPRRQPRITHSLEPNPAASFAAIATRSVGQKETVLTRQTHDKLDRSDAEVADNQPPSFGISAELFIQMAGRINTQDHRPGAEQRTSASIWMLSLKNFSLVSAGLNKNLTDAQ